VKLLKIIAFLGFFLQASSAFATKFATVQGTLDFLKDGDTVQLIVYKSGGFQRYQQWTTTYIGVVHNHHFVITVPLGGYPQYVDVRFPTEGNRSLSGYLLAQGDQISVSADAIAFIGKGSRSWNIQYGFNKIDKRYWRKYFSTRKILQDFMTVDSATETKINYLKSFKNLTPRDKYNLLYADLIGSNESGKYQHVFSDYESYRDTVVKLSKAIIRYRKSKSFINYYVPNEIAYHSNGYYQGIIDQYKIDSCILTGKPFLAGKAYWHLKERFKQGLKQYLITYLLFSSRRSNEDLSGEINNALTWVSDPNCLEILAWLKNTMIKGALAPEFSLTDMDGKKVKLSDFRGHVVLLDFWFTGCGACRELYPVLDSIEEKFSKKDVAFISISVDKNKITWLNSIQGNLYTSTQSNNLYTEGKGFGHPVIRQYNINGCPSLVLIDKKERYAQIRPVRGKTMAKVSRS
jgi:thiol-disulfide isomerase/thioredoxin